MAATRTANDLGFAIASSDDTTKTLRLRMGAPTRWPHQELTVAIHGEATGARLVIAGSLSGYRLAMADWRQAEAVASRFLERLKSVLPTVPEPAPRSSALDQLNALAELRDSGVLTEAEFAAEKHRLLG